MSVLKREKVYKTIGNIELLLHIFEAQDIEKGTISPAIVFFHGGGFRQGAPTQFFRQCEHLASRGMLAASAEYRLAGKHGQVSPLEAIADGKSAIRWIRTRASELGVDPSKIAAGGGSAGAFVAAVAAMIKGFDQPGEDLTISSEANLLVLFNPGFDATREHLASRLQGRAKDVSPLHHLRKGLPPTIIFHGTEDQLIPIAQIEKFRDKMVALGNICELVKFEGMEHGFFNYGRHESKPFQETLNHANRFLSLHGFLSGEPTTYV
jgi:acetyl esterase/lipase